MKIYFLFGFLLIFCCFTLRGQQEVDRDVTKLEVGSWDFRSRLVSLVNEYDKSIRDGKGVRIPLSAVEGSMYDVRTFEEGQVYVGDDLHASILMRYNRYSDEFEVKKNVGGEILGLSKSSSLTFVLNGARFAYLDFLDKNDNLVQGHLQILERNGKYKLFKRKVKLFREGKKAQTSYHKDIPHKFVDSESFYLAKESLYPKCLSNSKRILQSILDEGEWKLVKNFMKESKIQLNNQSDLIRLVGFLNYEIY